jgi:hypothetical protein
MAEADNSFPEIEIRQRIRYSPERFQRIVDVLREIAIEPIRTEIIPPDGEPILFDLPPTREEDPTIVTLQYFRRYYKEQFDDETPSALPKRVFDQAERSVEYGDLVTDGKGNVVAIRRSALETLVNRIQSGESKELSGPKTRRFIFGLVDGLPKKEE